MRRVCAKTTFARNNEVDVAFISTFGYLLLQAGQKKHPMVPVAALIAPDAKDNYKTAIVSKKTASLSAIEDLKQTGNKTRVAFVANGSTSGNLVPRLLFNGIGIKNAEEHFQSVQYAGTHAKGIELVLSDSVDVAAMGSSEWFKLDSMKKNRLRLLLLSSEIPLGPVLLNNAVDKELANQITEVLMKATSTSLSSMPLIRAWTVG